MSDTLKELDEMEASLMMYVDKALHSLPVIMQSTPIQGVDARTLNEVVPGFGSEVSHLLFSLLNQEPHNKGDKAANNMVALRVINDIQHYIRSSHPNSGYTPEKITDIVEIIKASLNTPTSEYRQFLGSYQQLCNLVAGPIDLGMVHVPEALDAVDMNLKPIPQDRRAMHRTLHIKERLEQTLPPHEAMARRINGMVSELFANQQQLFVSANHNTPDNVAQKLSIITAFAQEVLQEGRADAARFKTSTAFAEEKQLNISSFGYASIVFNAIEKAMSPDVSVDELRDITRPDHSVNQDWHQSARDHHKAQNIKGGAPSAKVRFVSTIIPLSHGASAEHAIN